MPPQSASGLRISHPASRIARRWLVAALVAGALLTLVAGAAASVVIYAGIYNIAADVPHTEPVYWLLEELRDRSVAARAEDIVVPKDLDEPKRISAGADNMRRCAAAATSRQA